MNNNNSSFLSYTEKSNFSCEDTTELDVSSAYQVTTTISTPHDSSSERDYDELDDELNRKAYLCIRNFNVGDAIDDDDDNDDHLYNALRRMSNALTPIISTEKYQKRLSIIPFQPNIRKQLTSVLNKTYFTDGLQEIKHETLNEPILSKKFIRCVGTSLKNCDWSDVVTLDIDSESTFLPLMCKLMIIIQGACVERGRPVLVRDASIQVSDKKNNQELITKKQGMLMAPSRDGVSEPRDSYYRRQSFHNLPEYTSIPYYQYQTVKNECKDASCNTEDFYVLSNNIFILNDRKENPQEDFKKKLALNVIEEHKNFENNDKEDADDDSEELEIHIPIEIQHENKRMSSKFKRKCVLFGEKFNRFEAEITLFKLKDANLQVVEDENKDNNNNYTNNKDTSSCKCNPISYSYHYHEYPNKIITLENSSQKEQNRKSVTHVYINHLVDGRLV